MDILQMKQMAASGMRLAEMQLRVVYYARVSTEKDAQLNSLANQQQFYHEFITKNQHWTYAGAYIDEGISGTSVKKRDAFLRMIEDAHAGAFDLIITKEISRFSRNTLDSIAYTRELLSCGVGVFFHNDNINTLDPDAELRLTIMAAIAQEEVSKLSQRTRFGFSKAQENGVLLGQDNIYGYHKQEKTLTVVPKEAEVVRRIYHEYIQGKLGLRTLARHLEEDGIRTRSGKPFTASTLRRMIDNPKYKGYYAGNKYTSVDYRDRKKLRVNPTEWIVFRDERIPAIVDEETWDEANRILAERSALTKAHGKACQNRYPYSGKLICAEHGTTYHRHVYHSKSRGDAECWNCRLYRQKGKAAGCDSSTIYSRELDAILEAAYTALFLDSDRLIQQYLENYQQALAEEVSPEQIRHLTEEKNRLEQRKGRLLELFLDGTLAKEEFQKCHSQLDEALGSVEKQLTQISMARPSVAVQKKRLDKIRQALTKSWEQNHGFVSDLHPIVLDHISVQKGEDKSHVLLDIYLRTGDRFHGELQKDASVFSLAPMGISQAQVSRLEKGALQHLRKYV